MDPYGLTTPEPVRAVIANADPVLRNPQITQSYHELSAARSRHQEVEMPGAPFTAEQVAAIRTGRLPGERL